MESKVTPLEIVLYLIAIPMILFGLYKAKISGFYEDEAPMVIGSLIIGAGVLGLAGLVGKSRKRAELQQRDRSRGIS